MLSDEARRISSGKKALGEGAPRGLAAPRCLTHLPNHYTKELVQDGSAETECREKLQRDLEHTQIQFLRRGENTRRMRNAGVRIVELEELVRSILHYHPSSTESFPSTPSPKPFKHRRKKRHFHPTVPLHREMEAFPRRNETFTVDNRHSNLRGFRDRDEEYESPEVISHPRDPESARQRNGLRCPTCGNQRAEDNTQRPRSNQRHEEYETYDQITSQPRDSEITEPRYESRYYDSRGKTVEHQVPAPRISSSTHHTGYFTSNLPSNLNVSNIRQPHPSQPRDPDHIFEGSPQVHDQPGTRRKSRRLSKNEARSHEAEPQILPRERSVPERSTEIMNEPPRNRPPDESISSRPHYPLPPDIHHKRRREDRQQRTSHNNHQNNSGFIQDRRPMPRRSNETTRIDHITWGNSQPGQPSRGPQTASMFSSSSYESDFEAGAPVDLEPMRNRKENNYNGGERRGRHTKSSGSGSSSSSRAYDSGYRSRSLSKDSELEPYPTPLRSERKDARYYPPITHNPDKPRRRRRRSSGSCSSSGSYRSSRSIDD